MPNTTSAKKRLRQSLQRRARNRAAKSVLKTQVRKVHDALESADVTTAQAEYRALGKRLDQAAARGVIHDNAAARVKSRLSKAVKLAKSGKSAVQP